MGVYIYLYCEKCKEYVHVGKVGHHDFELPYERMAEFLVKHGVRNGCNLVSITDSCDDGQYQLIMDGTEVGD